MNSKRTYLDAVNSGRQRRSYASLEQLNRSLESLEQRIGRNREEISGFGMEPHRRLAPEQRPRAEFEAPPVFARPPAPQTFAPQPPLPRGESHEPRGAFEPPYKSIARDIQRVRHEEDGVAAFGKIAGELKGLREELRHQMASSLHREFDALRSSSRSTQRAAMPPASSAWTSSACRTRSSRSANAATTALSTCCGWKSNR
jgi:localization factor PodJL